MRIGVIGLGTWGRQVVRKLPHRHLIAIAVRRKELHSDYEPLLASLDDFPRLNLTHCFVLSPVKALEKHTFFALKTGADVFAEKPCVIHKASLERIGQQLSRSESQQLYVNYLYKYSSLIPRINVDGCEYLRFSWAKCSLSTASLEENLLPHDISLLQMLFPKGQPFRVEQKISRPGYLFVFCRIAEIDVYLEYHVSFSAYIPQRKVLEVSCNGVITTYDFADEETDKLQASVNEFLYQRHESKRQPFEFHCAIVEKLNKVIISPEKQAKH